MVTPRSDHTAVRLLDGRVLVVGGENAKATGRRQRELYDPATGTWSATGDMLTPTSACPAVLLRDGTVLVGDPVYDPASGTWTSTGPWRRESQMVVTSMSLRSRCSETARPSWQVYDARLYDPASGTWTATGKMNVPRDGAAATLLSDGKVLVAGGTFEFPDNSRSDILD